jgi:hypothetical protein
MKFVVDWGSCGYFAISFLTMVGALGRLRV